MIKKTLLALALTLGIGCADKPNFDKPTSDEDLAALLQDFKKPDLENKFFPWEVEKSAKQDGMEPLPYKDLAIVIVDMQEPYVKSVRESEMMLELPNYLDVLDHADRYGVPVFVLENKGSGSTIPKLRNRLARMKTAEEPIKKYFPNGFYKTDFHQRLKEKGIKKLLFMGVYASKCVKETAHVALMQGYEVYTSGQLMADWEDRMEWWFKRDTTYKHNYKDLLREVGM